MRYLAILGRQPQISLAELVSLYGSDVQFLNFDLATISTEIDLSRLGGIQKIARIVRVLPHQDIIPTLKQLSDPDLLDELVTPSGRKLAIGISVYGQKVPPRELFRASLELKKKLKSRGQAARVIEGKGAILSAAQVLHNSMTVDGSEIVIANGQNKTLIAVTTAVQDINAYTQRDHARPARSAKVGMLPPKLAQIMINLANPAPGGVVLDPFCGTGVVLQEAVLMGYQAYGSDIEPELIDMSRTNLEWQHLSAKLEAGDATNHTWSPPIGAVVTEGYLGPALETEPNEATVVQLKQDATRLTLDFLSNIHPQIEAGTPICITLPAWRQSKGYQRLNIVDQIEALGYTLKQFLPVLQGDMLYHRPDQIVARELLTLIKL